MVTSEDEKTGRFTFAAEGSLDPSCPNFIGKLSHPSADSGVIIGVGYDMGERTEQQVRNDLLQAGVDANTAAVLAQGAGKKGIEADKFVAANTSFILRDLTVWEKLFNEIYPDYVSMARARYDYHTPTFEASMDLYDPEFMGADFFEWEDLYPAIRVLAIDFTFQGFGEPQPGFGRPMHFCMANDFDWLISYIESTAELNQYEPVRGRVAYLRERRFPDSLNPGNSSPRSMSLFFAGLGRNGIVDAKAQENAWEVLRAIKKAGITNKRVRANILAQVAAECGFRPRTEGHYTAARLFEIYGANQTHNKVRFETLADAQALVNKGDQAVFDDLYGDRMGNDTANDGYTYRGRGYIQLTGKENYQRVGGAIGVDLVTNPDLANDPQIATKVLLNFLGINSTNQALYADINKVNAKVGPAASPASRATFADSILRFI